MKQLSELRSITHVIPLPAETLMGQEYTISINDCGHKLE